MPVARQQRASRDESRVLRVLAGRHPSWKGLTRFETVPPVVHVSRVRGVPTQNAGGRAHSLREMWMHDAHTRVSPHVSPGHAHTNPWEPC